MATLAYHVAVTVNFAAAAVGTQNFGVPLGVFSHTVTANRIDYYAEVQEAIDDGHLSSSEVVKWLTAVFGQEQRPAQAAIGRQDVADAGDFSVTLDAIEAVDPDGWYWFTISARTGTEILDAAAWASARKKIFVAQSDDANVLTATTPNDAADLQTQSYNNVFYVWHALDAEYLDGAFVGRASAADLDQVNGQITMNMQALVGITVDSLTSTQINFAQGYNAILFTRIGESNVISEPWASSGRYLHHQTTLDWLFFRTREDLLQALQSRDLVGLDEQGIGLLQGVQQSRMEIGVLNGHLRRSVNASGDPTPRTTAPKEADISTADKTAQILRNLVSEAHIRNAVHRVITTVNVNP